MSPPSMAKADPFNESSSPKRTSRAASPKSSIETAELLRASSSKQAYTTEIVKALFGGAVGKILNDFSCSFQRQSGRLYVSTDGLFYYSNLFGFEKRIGISYDQALEITKIRTTSISVRTKGEEYIFRSFDDREKVLSIILRYHSNIREGEGENDATISSSATASDGPDIAAICGPLDSAVHDDSQIQNDCPLPDNPGKIKSLDSQENLKKKASDTSGDSSRVDAKYGNDVGRSWDRIKKLAEGWEPALVDLKIACSSVEIFFSLFLGDEANYSLGLFSQKVGDNIISIGKWNNDISDGNSLSRVIQLERNTGVSKAKISRQQTYQAISGFQSWLRNTTTIKGIKGVSSDAFFVQDIWFLEKFGDNSISLNVKFRVNFRRSTMLKSIIESRAKAETKDYFARYSTFVQQKMGQETSEMEEDNLPDAGAKNDASWPENLLSFSHQCKQELSTLLQCLSVPSPSVTVFIVLLSLHNLWLRFHIMMLEDNLADIERRLMVMENMRFVAQPLPSGHF